MSGRVVGWWGAPGPGAVLAALVLVISQAPASDADPGAETPYELLFRDGTIGEMVRGAEFAYRQETDGGRDLAETSSPVSAADIVRLRRETGDEVTLTSWQDKNYSLIGRFPADAGNPLILYFFEMVVRDVAHRTGGSPFYIRNRMKEALARPSAILDSVVERSGQSLPGYRVEIRPFARDANRTRMGAFADLSIEALVSEHVPGWLHTLRAATTASADAVASYNVSLRYISGEKAP